MRPASYSEIQQALSTLKVDISTRDAPLKKAYLDLVRQNHPDKGGSEAKMKEITTSYNLLKGLSNADRKSYQSSKSNYGPGAHQQADMQGRQRQTSYNNPHDAHDAYRKKYEQQTRGYYKYDPQTGNYKNAYADRMASNPWQAGPFPQAGRDLRHLPFASLLFRALVVYTTVSLVFLVMYRGYKDYTHDDGWVASQAAWRNERIDQLNAIRHEARQRVKDREEGALERRRQDSVTAREQRALDYAKRREQEMMSADHGAFPRLNPEGLEGLIMRDYNDPAGIAYYVPPLPNGAPPFSGNGRFMYSTGSVPRHQCVPTVVDPPPAAAMRRQAPPRNGSLAPTRGPGGRGPGDGMTLGDLGKPLSEERRGAAPENARPSMVQEIRESDIYAEHRTADNATSAGHTAPTTHRVVQRPAAGAGMRPDDRPGSDDEQAFAPPLTNGGVGLDQPVAAKPGYYGNQGTVDAQQGDNDQPLNMKRRAYRPPTAPGGTDNSSSSSSSNSQAQARSPAPGIVP
jgi:curved DNA-binding protein CbpA